MADLDEKTKQAQTDAIEKQLRRLVYGDKTEPDTPRDAADRWIDYLAFAAHHYKLDFADQLYLYDLHPEASAVATNAQWTSLGRTIIPSAQAIILPSGKELFCDLDIQDAQSIPIPRWSVTLGARKPMRTRLAIKKGLTLEEHVEEKIKEFIANDFNKSIFVTTKDPQTALHELVKDMAYYAAVLRIHRHHRLGPDVALWRSLYDREELFAAFGEPYKAQYIGGLIASSLTYVLEPIARVATAIKNEKTRATERIAASNEAIEELKQGAEQAEENSLPVPEKDAAAPPKPPAKQRPARRSKRPEQLSLTDLQSVEEIRDEQDAVVTKAAAVEQVALSEDISALIGREISVEGRRYKVDSINDALAHLGDIRVSLLDVDLMETSRYPVFRVERLSWLTDELDRQAKALEDKKRDQLLEVQKDKSLLDFEITADDFGVATPKERYLKNAEAIKTLKTIEDAGRLASKEEQLILSGYSGFGAIPDAFDATKQNWTNEFSELKNLLSETEYSAARASTLNAHFTSPEIIQAIWTGLENMGFKGGNVLEPACGIGNFIGAAPQKIRQNSQFYATELDPTTAAIARQLYQSADVQTMGYEQTDYQDNSFDLAISNVPFGSYGVADKRYDKHNLLIHDYFFAKSIDKVRPGGVIAFITSTGTLDKKNSKVRQYIAERADLLGAVRLPQGTFSKNAGTEVSTDIIFLQVRETPTKTMPSWVNTQVDEQGIAYNSYFFEHPEQMLGTMSVSQGVRMYGSADAAVCLARQDSDLSFAEQLSVAIKNIKGEILEPKPDVEIDAQETKERRSIPALPGIRDYSYCMVGGEVFYREGSRMYEPEFKSKRQRDYVRSMIPVKDALLEVIGIQQAGIGDVALRKAQDLLNTEYDGFFKKHDLRFSEKAAQLLLAEESNYPLLAALEVMESGNKTFIQKADIFTKRTIVAHREITEVANAAEALAASLSERGRVDLEWMARVSGLDTEALLRDLDEQIYLVPGTDTWQSAEEYLSGNVRKKLNAAKQALLADISYEKNVSALSRVLPEDIAPEDITVRLGAIWVEPQDYAAFLNETLDPMFPVELVHNSFDNSWAFVTKPYSRNIKVTEIYGTEQLDAFQIAETALNQRTLRITMIDPGDVNGKRQITDRRATEVAQEKLRALESAFVNWLWATDERREKYVRKYNDVYNAIRERDYDRHTLSLAGMNTAITLKEHQKKAVARQLYGTNTLLAHVVGAGKTYTMATAAMEMRHIGIANKPLIAVPKPVIGQWGREFMALYPTANILIPTERDFEKKNRKRFCGRIATGDYDAIIMTHQQLERIKCSREMRAQIIEDEIREITEAIGATGLEYFRTKKDQASVRQLEKTRRRLEANLKKLDNEKKNDDVLDFEALGIDALFIDEAHKFKSLPIYTKMRNVFGIQTGESQRALDMLMKCRHIQEKNNGRGVVFATGTPITNTMCELYTLQRYLQPETLKEQGINCFDAWASVFGQTQSVYELRPEGEGFVERTRFSRFYNLPELMGTFRDVADIQTQDMLNLPVPEVSFTNIKAVASKYQKQAIAELSKRAGQIRSGCSDQTDNMLVVTNDGRKLALDQRLYDETYPYDENGKVAMCIENVFEIYQRTTPDKSTQIIFCDLSTPNEQNKDQFCVYNEVKDRLVAKGIPKNEIAFIHDAKTDKQRQELFNKVTEGSVRVIMGSTEKLGTGVNIQERLIAAHDLDCPWAPYALEQRVGRIVRQGNKNKHVEVFRYITEGTFDAYMWQTIENKLRFITQIMTSKTPARQMDDVDEAVLSVAEVKALATGNPLIKEKLDLEVEITRLKTLESEHGRQLWRTKYKIEHELPERLQRNREMLRVFQDDVEIVNNNPALSNDDNFSVVINHTNFEKRADANLAILRLAEKLDQEKPIPLGQYRGFSLAMYRTNRIYTIELAGSGIAHRADFALDSSTNVMLRIDNALAKIADDIPEFEKNIENLTKEIQSGKELQAQALSQGFVHADALAEKLRRLDQINLELDFVEREVVEIKPDEAPSTESKKTNNYVNTFVKSHDNISFGHER